jgi:nucleolar protein 9
MSIVELLALCHHPIGSRVVDDFVASPTVPFHSKAMFITSLVGHFNQLADNRLGGHVAINLWNAADPYLRVRKLETFNSNSLTSLCLKKRIALSLAEQEDAMRSSPFARHLVKKTNLWQLRNQPTEWVASQTQDYRVTHTGRVGGSGLVTDL